MIQSAKSAIHPQGTMCVQIISYPSDVVSKWVSLHNLLRLVSVYDGLKCIEGPPTHHVSHAFLLYPETLDLIVDVEKQGIVPRGIVTWTDEETSGTTWFKYEKH